MSKKVKYLLDRHVITPSTDLDQHFLKDHKALMKIIGYANLTKDNAVLEIGPGLGFLTKELAKKAGRVVAVEKDLRFLDVLNEELSGFSNVQLIIENALEVLPRTFDKIVSNLPYNLCEPLLQKLQDYDFELAVLLVPRKFAFKMKGAGNIAKLCEKWRVELLDDVPPDCFYPKPKVVSKIVRLTRKGEEQ